jgi:hypothetical protein
MMIQLDIMKWLVKILQDHQHLSPFSLEYASALLMNLSLRSSGKRKCSKEDILSVLNDLLEHENPMVGVV